MAKSRSTLPAAPPPADVAELHSGYRLCESLARRVGAELVDGLRHKRGVDDPVDRDGGVLDQLALLEELQVVAQAGKAHAAVGVDRGRSDLAMNFRVLDEGVLGQDRD